MKIKNPTELYLDQLPSMPNLPELEEQVQAYWQKNQVFEESVNRRPKSKSYVFYDGPPFATGLPHYGHLLGSTSKDVVGRYWTMKGYRVERVWGWDCHGLPIENMLEKQLDIKHGKRGIEELGIDNFNQACRSEVMRLDTEWERIIARLGRWVDFQHNYKTMDLNYMESVWWAFQQLFNKGLVYQGKKVILYCPRCATPLSNFEIAMDNSYEMVNDPSVTIKFAVEGEENQYFLAWTTTPWTLPGNVALAVKPNEMYALVESGHEQYWLAEGRVEKVFNDRKFKVIKSVQGLDLIGKKYQPLYPYLRSHQTPTAWSILGADFVSLEDGTGIVHTAAMFGEDDYALAVKENLPLVQTLDEEGKFLPMVELVAGQFYKKADQTIVDDLVNRNLMFESSTIEHSYPFCYRCQTPLYYNAVPAWFIDIQKLKPKLIAENQHMNWYPDHLKEGRFGQGLAMAPDWNISRSRYWGTPMPIWEEVDSKRSDQPRRRIIGSLAELKKWAVDPKQVEILNDIHREFVDQIEIWIDDQKTIKGRRIREVFDCWVESGSMPFASRHYPFENQTEFEDTYPAQFVSEYIAQTRAWFYTMHVMSVALFDKFAVKNTLTTGTILAENGEKMSKSKKNYPDPMAIINQSGVDSLRLYLMSSPVMKGENINFQPKEVADIRKKVFIIWWNVMSFYRQFADPMSTDQQFDSRLVPEPSHVMDRWILSRLSTVHQEVEQSMVNYDLVTASRSLMGLVDELSTWYIRRSRDRFRNSETQPEAMATLGFVLYRLAQLFAPITPFFSELVAHNLLPNSESIHLSDWPEVNQEQQHPQLETNMLAIRKVAEKAHALRKESGIRVRQPLATLTVKNAAASPKANLLDVLAEEINVKKIEWQEGDGELDITLDTKMSPELIAEGEARELIRSIQLLRKAAGLQSTDQVQVQAPSWPADWQSHIEKTTHTKLIQGEELGISN